MLAATTVMLFRTLWSDGQTKRHLRKIGSVNVNHPIHPISDEGVSRVETHDDGKGVT
jgi:hypothetical protein